MTEQEWDSCCDPKAMSRVVNTLGNAYRKLKLVALECCFRVKHLLDLESLAVIGRAARAIDELEFTTISKNNLEFVQVIGWNQSNDVLPYTVQANLLREIVGNPFRPVRLPRRKSICEWCGGSKKLNYGPPERKRSGVQVARESDPLLLKCLRCDGRGWFYIQEADITPQIQALAEQCYQGDWDAVGPLSDALEEYGYEESHPVLEHLRGKCLRVKGCWAIDLLTGRK